MKPAPFEYYAPTTLEEALNYLTEYGYEAKLLAGGQSLIPAMNFRLAQPAILIDLNQISELAYIQLGVGGLAPGSYDPPAPGRAQPSGSCPRPPDL